MSSRSSRMSAVPSTPSTPGRASAVASRPSSSPAVGHGQRVVARRRAHRGPGGRRRPASAGRWADQAGAAGCARRPARRSAPGSRTRVGDEVGRASTRRWLMPPPSSELASTSAVVGIASAQASRPATIAPAALAKRSIALDVPARQQAVAQRAAERVAGAEPVDDVDRHGRHHDGLVAARRPEHTRRALLDHGEVDARRRAARLRRRCGSRSPTAISHSSRLPTATSTRATRLADVRVGLVARRPEHRPVVEVEDGGAVVARAPRARPSWPPGTAPAQSPVPVTQKMSAARDRVEVELVGADLRGRARSAAGRSRAGSRRAGRSRRT